MTLEGFVFFFLLLIRKQLFPIRKLQCDWKSCRKCFREEEEEVIYVWVESGERFWEWLQDLWNWKNWAELEEHLGLGNGIGDIRSWATEQQQKVRKWKKKRFPLLESLDLSLKYSKSSTRKSLILSSELASRKMDSPSDTFPGSFIP